MARTSLSIEQVLELLAAAPERMAALTAGVEPALLRTPPAPEEWSANDVLAHLRACADMWGGSIETMLAGEHPTIRAINPRSWIKQTDYRDLEFGPSLEAFTAQRAELLRRLKAMPPDGWSRSATFTGAGNPVERSVFSQAQRLVVHERPHLKQIEQIVNAVRR